MAKVPLPKLDRIDRKLLQLLQEDASLPIAELAAALNLSRTPCWRRNRVSAGNYNDGDSFHADPQSA